MLFFLVLGGTGLVFTLLYFNYFENDLVRSASEEFERLRVRPSVKADLDERTPLDAAEQKGT